MVTTDSAAGRSSRAGLMAALAAGLILTAADAGPAGAFGLGSIGDIVKGMTSPPPPAHKPEKGAQQGEQDGASEPPSAPASEPPARTEGPRADEGPAPSSVAPNHDLPSARQREQAAAPANDGRPQPLSANPSAAPTQAAAPEAHDATEPDNAGTAPAGIAQLPAPTPDYYAERAKEVLAQEEKGQIKLHPVQLAAPDYDITLCEAGCSAPGVQILSKRLKSEAVSVGDPGSKLKSAALDQGPDCLGGCTYSNDVPAGHSASGRKADGEAGAWLTTTKPRTGESPEPAPVASPAVVPAETPGALVAPSPAPAKAASKMAAPEDWMARINRERAAKKVGQEKRQGDGIGPVAPLKVETQ